MSVQSEIDRISTAVGNAYSKVSEKGGTVPASQTVANIATAIDSIPAGSAPSLQSKSVTYTENGTATITPDDGYDGLSSVDVTVDVSGGGSGVGHKVTFPATAKNWDMVSSNSVLYLADNTTKSIADYSSISGQTIENVIGIGCQSIDEFHESYILKMNLSEGGIASAIINTGGYIQPNVSTAPGSTPSYYYRGMSTFWWPVADTVISAIEMYDTDS